MEKSVNEDFTIRQLQENDAHAGLLAVLAQLAPIGEDVSDEHLQARVQELVHKSEYKPMVAERQDGRIIGYGNLVIEKKLTHSLSKAGHVEDVVTARDARGIGVGSAIVKALMQAAKDNGCYKAILDCSDANAGFYEKLGFRRNELQMRHDLD